MKNVCAESFYNDVIKCIVSMKCKETYWYFSGIAFYLWPEHLLSNIQRNMLNMQVNVKEVEHEGDLIPACHG